ncbi:MAG TPA: TolC family protein [Gemmatimonadales bacterium]|nr:TolC family protein [Gemmatimonadales bacterium]
MRVRLIVGWLVVLTMVAAIGYAQAPPVRKLSLADALDVARQNNPDYLKALAEHSPAAWALTNATASLFTPTLGVQGGYSYRAAAAGQNIQGLQVGSTPTINQTSAGVGLNYQLSGTSFSNRGYAAAQLRAADQDAASAYNVLQTNVRRDYITLLEARAQADLAEHVVTRAQELLNLAQARYNVGQNTMIDVRQAQVTKGNADVALLQARQNVDVQVLTLFQDMGVPAPVPPRVEPTDSFPVVEPSFDPDSLVALALRANPILLANQARQRATRWSVRGAYSQYLPSLAASASTGKQWTRLGAYTSSLGGAARAIPDTSYSQSSPWQVSLQLTLPIYDGFSRNVQIGQANLADEQARQTVRAQELQVRSSVVGAYLALMTAYRTIAVQANNRTAAEDALSLATERYRVGSGSIIELNDAQVAAEQAGVTYINAVYDYHKAIAALEQAVGQPLR